MIPGISQSAVVELELTRWWCLYNDLYIGGALRPPVLRVGDAEGQLGAFDLRTRTLTIAAAHLRDAPWLGVMETLRHEMAHQYAFEVLGAGSEAPHGPAFRAACVRLRVAPRATGGDTAATPGAAGQPPPRSAIIARVQKLLALGASPNANEAEVAVRKARELLLAHNIDDLELGGPREYAVRWLGPVKCRHARWEQELGGILGSWFFVSPIWLQTFDVEHSRRARVLAIYGTAANLEMAAWVYGYLAQLLPALWRDYRATRGLAGDRERLRYFAGVLEGFDAKLTAQDRTLRRQRALVWRGDASLEKHVRHHHPHATAMWTGAPRTTDVYRDAVSKGQTVVLRRPLRRPGHVAGLLAGD